MESTFFYLFFSCIDLPGYLDPTYGRADLSPKFDRVFPESDIWRTGSALTMHYRACTLHCQGDHVKLEHDTSNQELHTLHGPMFACLRSLLHNKDLSVTILKLKLLLNRYLWKVLYHPPYSSQFVFIDFTEETSFRAKLRHNEHNRHNE